MLFLIAASFDWRSGQVTLINTVFLDTDLHRIHTDLFYISRRTRRDEFNRWTENGGKEIRKSGQQAAGYQENRITGTGTLNL